MNIVQATAGTDATPGIYYVTVTSRAQSHQVAGLSKGDGGTPTAFTSTTDDVGTGDLNFAFEKNPTKNFKVTINSTMTLSPECVTR